MNANSVIKFNTINGVSVLLQSGNEGNLTVWGFNFTPKILTNYKDVVCGSAGYKKDYATSNRTDSFLAYDYVIGVTTDGKLNVIWDAGNLFFETLYDGIPYGPEDCRDYSESQINSNIKSKDSYKGCILKKLSADPTERNYYGGYASNSSQEGCLKNEIGTLTYNYSASADFWEGRNRVTKYIDYKKYCKPRVIIGKYGNTLETSTRLTTLGRKLKNESNVLKIVGRDPYLYAVKQNEVIDIFGNISLTVGIGVLSGKNMPLNTSGVIDYQYGDYHSIALLNNKTITGWGYGNYKYSNGTFGDGTYYNVPINNNRAEIRNQGQLLIPASIQGKVTGISVGKNHTVALLDNGFLTGWGYRINANVKINSDNTRYYIGDSFATKFPLSISGKIKKVKAGDNFTKILLKDGTVTGFGEGFGGTISTVGYPNGTSIYQPGDYNISPLIEVNKKFSGYIEDFDFVYGSYVIKSGSIIYLTSNAYKDKTKLDMSPTRWAWYSDNSYHPPTRPPLLRAQQNEYTKQLGLDASFYLNIETDTPELPITYKVANTSIASCDQNGLVTINNSGSTYIQVSQDGKKFFNDQYYQPGADPLHIPLVVNPKLQQYITFAPLSVKTLVNDNNFRLSISSNSPLPITLGGYDTNIIEITNNYVNIKNTGTTTITASQAGNSAYFAASNVSQSLTIIYDKNNQILNVEDIITGKQYGNIVYLPSRTDANLPITYSSSNLAVEIVNYSGIRINYFNPLQIEQSEINVVATQSGEDYYYPIQKNISMIISKKDQTITFPSIPSQKFRKSIFYITGNSDSNLRLNYLISNSGIARIINASGIKMLKTGTFEISGTQPGNDYYEAATPVVRNFTILKGTQTIKL